MRRDRQHNRRHVRRRRQSHRLQRRQRCRAWASACNDASLDNPILEDSIFSNEDLGIAIDNSEPQSRPCWVSP